MSYCKQKKSLEIPLEICELLTSDEKRMLITVYYNPHSLYVIYITIDLFFVDPDSSKLDLSKELANDFSNAFDSLIDASDLQHLHTDDDFVSKVYS